MSVLLGRDTRVLVQGMGREGTFHATRMREYGTKVVGGVVPGAGGTTREGFPIFDTVSRATIETGANASIIFVPASGAMDAMLEALDAELDLVIVIVGEIGGSAEESAAEYMRANGKKPAVAFIAGRSAPPGKRMGHAGAIVSGSQGTAESKIRAFRDAGIPVADAPSEIPQLVQEALGRS